jgi:hypothetical protein
MNCHGTWLGVEQRVENEIAVSGGEGVSGLSVLDDAYQGTSAFLIGGCVPCWREMKPTDAALACKAENRVTFGVPSTEFQLGDGLDGRATRVFECGCVDGDTWGWGLLSKRERRPTPI